MRHAHPAAAARRRLLSVLCACAAVLLPGCGLRSDACRPARSAALEADRAASRRIADLERLFEERAAEARIELESALRTAEPFVGHGRSPDASRRAEAARQEARRALRRGSEILARAAENGGRSAESWARLIQDRMMRLEQILNRLSDAGEHADS